MRRAAVIILAGSLVVAACSSSDDAESAETCDDLAEAGLTLIQDVLNELDDMSIEDLVELGDEEPEAFLNLEAEGEALDTKATELGCEEDELSAFVASNVDDLEADGPVSELILEQIKANPAAFFG
jgi:hypothetical protein